ncbi:MAG: DUF6544 family protein [Steroidobacteraceae bacterium]
MGIATLLMIVLTAGELRWRSLTKELWQRLSSGREKTPAGNFSVSELQGLPPPVQKYLQLALAPGQPLISAVAIHTEGTFNTGEIQDSWYPFSARQLAVMNERGFVWDGSVKLVPGVRMLVHDAYVTGEGILRPSVAGLVDITHLQGSGEIARGELMRFLAESPWYPSALLPREGVTWTPIDEHSALATLRDHAASVSLTFRFSDDGMIASIRAEDRSRAVGGKMVPTPWEGRWWDYRAESGMQVPGRGEVAWILDTGAKPYWRGRVTTMRYEFAR